MRGSMLRDLRKLQLFAYFCADELPLFAQKAQSA